MTIERIGERAGVNVQLDPEECELFLKLARDAAKEAAEAANLHKQLANIG